MLAPKKVLIAHVPYQHRGGEDVHVETLARAYRKIGIEPVFFPSQREPQPPSLGAALASLLPTASSPVIETAREESGAHFIHLHNAFPNLGPRFFRWVIDRKIPMIMTVHNHRFYCTNGLALRDGKTCKDCLGSKIPWRPVAYDCNEDRAKSFYHGLALAQMRSGNLYDRAVRKFIAPSPYIAEELLRFGVREEKIQCLLNPVEFPEVPQEPAQSPKPIRVFYAGRISKEKGLDTLIEAARLLPEMHFWIAGDGSEKARLISHAPINVSFLGAISRDEVRQGILKSNACVLPSICNEILPTFVIESFFLGKPCVVPDLKSTRWLAQEGLPGYLALPSDPISLMEAIKRATITGMADRATAHQIRKRFSFERFCDGLEAIARLI